MLAQALRAGIVGEEFEKFVFEDAGATWFKKDEGQAGLDLRRHAIEHAGEVGAGGAEQAEVIKRTATADVPFGNFNLEAGLGEDGFGGCECLRMVVVVPGIRPENDRRGCSLVISQVSESRPGSQ